MTLASLARGSATFFANCRNARRAKESYVVAPQFEISSNAESRIERPSQTLFLRRNLMEYKGAEYSIVQLIDGSGWRWEIRFGEGGHKAGVTPVSRAAAIKLAEYEIDRALKDRE
jgi:hypothetical protein